MNQNILILCTGNSARSQIAEGYLRKYIGDRFNVYSAGLKPAAQVHPMAVAVMAEAGIDISGHVPESVKDYMGKMAFRYVITVCAHADENCPSPLWSLGEKLHWPFEDPAAFVGDDEEMREVFRETRDMIEARIKNWTAELHKEAT